jgi:hypothetical protein
MYRKKVKTIYYLINIVTNTIYWAVVAVRYCTSAAPHDGQTEQHRHNANRARATAQNYCSRASKAYRLST